MPVASAFGRLAALLDDLAPPVGVELRDLHLGEPKFDFSRQQLGLLADASGWHAYPPLGGTAELRRAYGEWLDRHFHVGGLLDSGRIEAEPSPGSKQAIATVLQIAVRAKREAGFEPVVVLPNPFYPTYAQATAQACAQAAWYEATLSHRTVERVEDAACAAGKGLAAIVVCSPASPAGHAFSATELDRLLALAQRSEMPLLVDESYIDLHCGSPPPGMLSRLLTVGARPDSLVTFHTLSKRSCAGGLRSGFIVGDPAWISRYADFNRTCGVSLSHPACRVSARLWEDEAHVASLRRGIDANWNIADEVLAGVPGYSRALTGFFLWLPVADDERLARRLWSTFGVRVMPGSYLGVADTMRHHPGAGHLRVALVHPPEAMRDALLRVREAIESEEPTVATALRGHEPRELER